MEEHQSGQPNICERLLMESPGNNHEAIEKQRIAGRTLGRLKMLVESDVGSTQTNAIINRCVVAIEVIGLEQTFNGCVSDTFAIQSKVCTEKASKKLAIQHSLHRSIRGSALGRHNLRCS